MIEVSLSKLYVYPIKSCRGYSVSDIEIAETGLKHDRTFMLVDKQTHHFVTQRTFPQMSLISTEYKLGTIVVRAPGMLRLDLPLDIVGDVIQVSVWQDKVNAFDMGDVAAHWFSTFLKHAVRLVRFDPEGDRICSRRWTGAQTGKVEFADGFSLLVMSSASLAHINQRLEEKAAKPVSMNRFRPNIVLDNLEPFEEDAIDTLRLGDIVLKFVKPCSRCEIPNIEVETGQMMQEPMMTLASFRSNSKMKGAICVGMNAVVIGGAGKSLQTGQLGTAQIAFGLTE